MKTEAGDWVTIEGHKPVTHGRVEKMSKSKRNTVAPERLIKPYGADAARLFILSDSPPDRDMEWTDSGIEGAWKYVNRLWRIITEALPRLPAVGTDAPESFSDNALALRQAGHQTLAALNSDLDSFNYNRAVARLREYSNEIAAFAANAPSGEFAEDDAWTLREALELLTRLINPMMPHLTEELWQALGHTDMLAQTPWPEPDPALLVEDTVTLPVQVNGKLRATLDVPKDASKDTLEELALANDNVQRAIDGKSIRKVIVVPGRVVNLVVG